MGTIYYGDFFFDIDEFEVTERIKCHFYNWDETPFYAVRLRKVFHDRKQNKDIEIIRWMSEQTYKSMLEVNDDE